MIKKFEETLPIKSFLELESELVEMMLTCEYPIEALYDSLYSEISYTDELTPIKRNKTLRKIFDIVEANKNINRTQDVQLGYSLDEISDMSDFRSYDALTVVKWYYMTQVAIVRNRVIRYAYRVKDTCKVSHKEQTCETCKKLIATYEEQEYEKLKNNTFR